MIDWTLTHADASSAIVWVRSDTAETVSIVLPHGTFSTSVDPGVEDGTGSITVTGLSGDVAGTINGEPITVKVAPASPVIAVASCVYATRDDWAYYLAQQGVNITVLAGDMPYADDSASTAFGITTVKCAFSIPNSASSEYAKHYLQYRRAPGTKRLLQSALMYATWDDHEFVNNFDWSVSSTNVYATLANNAGEVRAFYDRAATAWKWYNDRGNQHPSSGLETDPPAIYSTARHGDVEIFILDCISHRSAVTATDNASKYMIGPLQEAKLIADVTASTAPFKLIVSSKQPYTNASANADSWVPMGINTGYTTQRNRIIAALAGVTGVVWASGDDHSATVAKSGACLVVSGCPGATANQVSGQGAGYEPGVIWKGFGYSGSAPATHDYYATNIFRVIDGELSLEVHDLTRRTIWWRMRMRQDGTTYYPPTRAA